MKKYDCSISKDLIHETNRMCSSIKNCCNCPLNSPFYHCSMEANKISNDVITIIQKWSDEHPEKPPKLTRTEYKFLSGFRKIDNRYIVRNAGSCYVFIPDMDCQIGVAFGMFNFIQEGMGNGWSFEELLELEVEDE